MANKLYDSGREAFLKADVDWLVHDFKVVLLSSAYTYSAAHDFLDDLAGTVATSGNLASKTATAGVADAADVTFSTVSGSVVTQLVIYRDTGTPATSELIAHIDTGTGLPVTPNGGDIVLVFSNATEKIFKL